jgi:hypothetical protein
MRVMTGWDLGLRPIQTSAWLAGPGSRIVAQRRTAKACNPPCPINLCRYWSALGACFANDAGARHG